MSVIDENEFNLTQGTRARPSVKKMAAVGHYVFATLNRESL